MKQGGRKDDERQDPAGNAPQRGRGLLFPLGIFSLLLGLLFILFWFLLGQASDLPDISSTEVETRRWISRALASAPKPAPRTGKKRPCIDTW